MCEFQTIFAFWLGNCTRDCSCAFYWHTIPDTVPYDEIRSMHLACPASEDFCASCHGDFHVCCMQFLMWHPQKHAIPCVAPSVSIYFYKNLPIVGIT